MKQQPTDKFPSQGSPERVGESRSLWLCPITRAPCEGRLSYLCEDYGCARKGGLSPHPEENL